MRSRGMRLLLPGIVMVIAGQSAQAQIPFTFKFKEGVPVRYKTTQERKVEFKQKDEVSTLVSSVKQLKRWDVTKVDTLNVATLELSIEELQLEQTDSSGETLKYDSTNAEASDQQLTEQLSPMVGRPIVQVQLDNTGVVKAFKHLTQRDDVLRELPFMITVPSDKIPTVGVAWRRDFPIVIDPPISTPTRTLRAVQNCTVKASDSQTLVVTVDSKLLEEVKETKMMIPVVQFLPKGEVTLDPKAGKMVSATMKVDETVPEIQGPGSHYKYSSSYTEELVTDLQQADNRK